MQGVERRVPPELIEPALNRPTPRRTVAEIDIRRGPAREGRRWTLPRCEPVLEPVGRKQVGQYTVGAVELADLAERSVGDEVDRVLTISHGKVDGEPACRVGRIVGHEVAGTICFDRPSGL